MFVAILAALVAGAVLTSLAEYRFKYNLVDYIVDLLRSVKAKEQAVVHEIQVKVTADTTQFHQELDKIAARFKELAAAAEKRL